MTLPAPSALLTTLRHFSRAWPALHGIPLHGPGPPAFFDFLHARPLYHGIVLGCCRSVTHVIAGLEAPRRVHCLSRKRGAEQVEDRCEGGRG